MHSVLNIFIDQCESIDMTNEQTTPFPSTPTITHAIITLLDPFTTIVEVLKGIELPESTTPYTVMIDHGIQNGFGKFRFSVYKNNETYRYCSVDDEYIQQANKILYTHYKDMSKEDIIHMLLEQKGDMLTRIQQCTLSMCRHTDYCEDCPLYKSNRCPNKEQLPEEQDWIQFLTTLPQVQ